MYSVNYYFLGYIPHCIQVLSSPYLSFVIICICTVGQVGNFLQKCTKIGFYFLLQEVQNKTEHQLSVYLSNFQQTVLFFISSLVLAKSAYLKVARAHMPDYCFCFSNLHRFTVFAFVKSLNCFAICSVLTEAFSLCDS